MKFTGVDIEEEIVKEAKILAVREGITLKELHKRIFVDYIKKHSDGTPNFTLDQFDREEMKAVPAVFRDLPYWQNYIEGMNETDFREMETQVYAIKDKLDKKWEKGFWLN